MYKVVDTLGFDEERILSEKEIRDIYKENVMDILYNWKDCGDSKIVNDLMEELANVYTCDMQFVIDNLREDMGYNIEKIEGAK